VERDFFVVNGGGFLLVRRFFGGDFFGGCCRFGLGNLWGCLLALWGLLAGFVVAAFSGFDDVIYRFWVLFRERG
jgi:hypothetical protein